MKRAIPGAGGARAAAGCVERRVAYVPAYRAGPPVYQAQPAYQYPPQTACQASPPASPKPVPASASTVSNPAPLQPAPAALAMRTQAPPAPQVQVEPVAPGPDYCRVPDYWSWKGGWVRIGGNGAAGPGAQRFGCIAVWPGTGADASGWWALALTRFIWVDTKPIV